jgi:hypothetical protein
MKLTMVLLAALPLLALAGCTTADLVRPPNWSPQQQAAATQLSGQLMAAPPPITPLPPTRCYTNRVYGTYVTRCMP